MNIDGILLQTDENEEKKQTHTKQISFILSQNYYGIHGIHNIYSKY